QRVDEGGDGHPRVGDFAFLCPSAIAREYRDGVLLASPIDSDEYTIGHGASSRGRHRPQCSVNPVLALMARFPTGRGTVAILVEARSLPGAVRTRSARRSRRGAVLRRQPTDVQGHPLELGLRGGFAASCPPLAS